MPIRYEYKLTNYSRYAPGVEQGINDMAAKGWEIFSLTWDREGDRPKSILFRREVPPPPDSEA